MAILPKTDLVTLTDALEALGDGLRRLFESIDWTSKRADFKRWHALRLKMTEFESLSVLVETRRAGLEPAAASTLKPWLDRLIYEVALRALQAEARLAQVQHDKREIPLFGRELFTQALRRLDRLMAQVKATSPEPARDRLVLERAQHERKDLIELIHRAPQIPDFGARPSRREERVAA